MNEIARMKGSSLYTKLQAQVARGLLTMEHAGKPIEDALAELAKTAVVLSLPVIGPEETIAGLHELTRQLENEFPDEAKRARFAAAMDSDKGGHA